MEVPAAALGNGLLSAYLLCIPYRYLLYTAWQICTLVFSKKYSQSIVERDGVGRRRRSRIVTKLGGRCDGHPMPFEEGIRRCDKPDRLLQCLSMAGNKVMEQLVLDLINPGTRENALLELSKRRESFPELAPFLWHSFGTVAALIQEVVSIYPVLSPPVLSAHASNRVCNALALLQCLASHQETRSLFLKGSFTFITILLFTKKRTCSLFSLWAFWIERWC